MHKSTFEEETYLIQYFEGKLAIQSFTHSLQRSRNNLQKPKKYTIII